MHLDFIDLVFLNRSSSSAASSVAASPADSSGAAMSDAKKIAEAVCPVDHSAREAWLAQARAQYEAQSATLPASGSTATRTPPPSAPAPSWMGSLLSYLPFSSAPSPQATPGPTSPNPLDTHREVSSIPRTAQTGPSACPANHEQETGSDQTSGNWIYPSEKMFFDAMKRKGHGAMAEDMKTVVPIHNAVNERAWKEIKEWEAPYTGEGRCAGPKLHSFAGLSTKMSPKARINTILGYTAPFDRHDWVVDRCGTTVEYVIDFYAGRPDAHGRPSFYLDVRPKLNSWEGVKMRLLRGAGLV